MAREQAQVVGALVDLLRQAGARCIVQVGAEDGWEADQIRLATGCRAVAIEADENCRPCSADLEYYHALIGATDCASTAFYIYGPGLSTTYPRDLQGKLVWLPQQRLDTFCARAGLKPDALIIDTEGGTMDVLEGCGQLLERLSCIYAEVQAHPIRPGIRPVSAVNALLLPMGFTQHWGLPSYDGGPQSNLTWMRR